MFNFEHTQMLSSACVCVLGAILERRCTADIPLIFCIPAFIHSERRSEKSEGEMERADSDLALSKLAA